MAYLKQGCCPTVWINSPKRPCITMISKDYIPVYMFHNVYFTEFVLIFFYFQTIKSMSS